MKGILSWVGFKTVVIEYKRQARVFGITKFNGWKLWNLALEGITSFSTAPLQIWSYLDSFIAIIGFIYAFIIIFEKYFLVIRFQDMHQPSTMEAILFLGGIQLIGIRILSEYLGRIYMETKERSRYIMKRIRKNDK